MECTRSTHLTFVGPLNSHQELEWSWLQGSEECIDYLSSAVPGVRISKHYGMSALCIQTGHTLSGDHTLFSLFYVFEKNEYFAAVE